MLKKEELLHLLGVSKKEFKELLKLLKKYKVDITNVYIQEEYPYIVSVYDYLAVDLINRLKALNVNHCYVIDSKLDKYKDLLLGSVYYLDSTSHGIEDLIFNKYNYTKKGNLEKIYYEIIKG
jgi:hypothetical protein